MDVRIGVTQAPRELSVELADDTDRRRPRRPDRRRPEGCGRRALAHRQARPAGRRAGGEDRLRRDRHARRRPAHRLRQLRESTLSPTLLDRRLVFVTGKGGVGKTTIAAALGAPRRDAGQARARLRDGRQGFARRGLRHGPAEVRAAPARAGPVRHVDEHRGLAARVPAAVRAHPADRPHRAAGPHVRLRRRRGARREGDPRRRQALLRGARAPLRPGRRRRRGDRPHRRPDRRAAGDQRPGAGRHGARPDRRGCSSCSRTRPPPASSSSRRRRRCRSPRPSSSSSALAQRDLGGRRRRRGQPCAARAVRPRRGGDLRAHRRRRPGDARSGAAGRGRRRRCSMRPGWR